jgi:hypothetical protein
MPWRRRPAARILAEIVLRCVSTMYIFLLWCLLLVFCWPLALLVLFVYPLVWLILLPFRLIGMTFDAVFETLHAVLTLPARVARRLA